MMSQLIAIIGGSGLSDGIEGFELRSYETVKTVYGAPSARPAKGVLGGAEVVFLPRHGSGHTVAPHKINYRANIAALSELGVSRIIAINAVGGITPLMAPDTLALPTQIIDYSWGRESTFYDGVDNPLQHVDFSEPYSEPLRKSLLQCAANLKLPCVDGGVYACTQGPRLETAAEIQRLKRDGCDLVGMTGMPEAVLARELGIEYASLCLVVNWGAGIQNEPITMAQIEAALARGVGKVQALLSAWLVDHSST